MKKNNKILFIGIGFELVALVLLAVFLGLWLEENYSQNGLWLTGLIMSALIIWIIHIVILVKIMEKNEFKK